MHMARYFSGMARPSVLGTVKRRMVSLPEELSERVDDYRFENRITTESEAIRRLIEAGLKAKKPKRSKAAQR